MFGFRNSGGPWVQSYLDSRTLVVILVAYALLLDNMLLTSIGKFFSNSYYCQIEKIIKKNKKKTI